jgi:hypothetical protein
VGRPPIGKRAMSSAERQRRYWQRVLQGEAAQPDDAAKAQSAALEQELARARQRIAELEAAVGTQRQPPPFPHSRTAAEWEALKAKATAERKAKRAAAAEARRAVAGVQEPPDVPTLLAENESLTQQLKATRTQIRNLKGQISYFTRMQGAVFTPELEKNIRVCLHPDWISDAKQKRRYEETLAEFNAVMDTKKKGRAR